MPPVTLCVTPADAAKAADYSVLSPEYFERLSADRIDATDTLMATYKGEVLYKNVLVRQYERVSDTCTP